VLVRAGKDAPWWRGMNPPPLPDRSRGAQLFQEKGCESCHTIGNLGGARGPNLTYVGDRLSHDELVWPILNGGNNMPAYGSTLDPDEVNALVGFLETRKASPRG